MKIPKKLTIYGCDYNIEWHENLKDTSVSSQKDELGSVSMNIKTIRLQKHCNGQTLDNQTHNETILHEVLHVVLWHVKRDMYQDEQFIDSIVAPLYQVFKQLEGK